MAREKQLYDKPWKRTADDTKQERDLCYGRTYDLKNNKKIEFFWDLSAEAKRDRIFKMTVDGKDYLVDADEIMKFVRWV